MLKHLYLPIDTIVTPGSQPKVWGQFELVGVQKYNGELVAVIVDHTNDEESGFIWWKQIGITLFAFLGNMTNTFYLQKNVNLCLWIIGMISDKELDNPVIVFRVLGKYYIRYTAPGNMVIGEREDGINVK